MIGGASNPGGPGSIRRDMRIRLVWTLLVAAVATIATVAPGCTRHNPASCCSTQEQCDSFGLKGITGCASDQVCDSTGTCQMAQCMTSADCTSPAAPVCIDQLCTAKCMTNMDCTGLSAAPYCASDGACVACTDSSQCSADAPVCDSTTRSCRACTVDSECASGVCEEAIGACAAASDIVYLSLNGTDSGDCTSAAPCATFGYALGEATGARDIVRILAGTFDVGASTIAVTGRSLVIDGEMTTLTYSGSTMAPIFSVGSGAVVTFEGLSLTSNMTYSAITVASGGEAKVYGSSIVESGGPAALAVTGGHLQVAEASFMNTRATNGRGADTVIDCSGGGSAEVDHSVFHSAQINSDGCTLTVRRNVFDQLGDGSVMATNGLLLVENNLIQDTYELADSMDVYKVTSPGSTIRFNTFVNTSGLNQTATDLFCDASVVVTSNIFAWHSSNTPQGCTATHSLFDTIALQPGPGNQSADVSTFFVDMDHKDFHLAPNSPAKGLGEPGLVTEDLDGNPRPQPAGSNPDVGAYEAP